MSDELILFLKACLLGGCCGFMFDLFRILRLAIPHIWIMVFLEDFSYFLSVTLCCLWFVLMHNNGVLRGFLIVGICLGGLLYFLTLSFPIMRLAKWVIRVIYRVIRGVWKTICIPIFRPFQRLFVFFARFYQKIRNFMKKVFRKCKTLLKRGSDKVYNDIGMDDTLDLEEA